MVRVCNGILILNEGAFWTLFALLMLLMIELVIVVVKIHKKGKFYRLIAVILMLFFADLFFLAFTKTLNKR